MTAARRTALAKITVDHQTNAGLWLDKYLPVQTDGSGAGSGDKSTLIEDICNIKTPNGYGEAFAMRKATLSGSAIRTVNATVDGRMVVGLGNKGVVEVGITLDHTWGVPCIPGSALKGLAAATAHHLLGGPDWSKPVGADGKRIERAANSYDVVFGATDDRGGVIFHDAWWVPSDDWPLKHDVITVHHPDYYSDGSSAPSDFDSPIPVAFVSSVGTYLVAVEASSHLAQPVEPWLDSAMLLLQRGLAELGIGAKTSSGYGRMKLVYETTSQRQEREGKAAAERMRALESRVQHVNASNAGQMVPDLLKKATDPDERTALATMLVKKLGAKWLRGRKEKEWAKDLMMAAGIGLE